MEEEDINLEVEEHPIIQVEVMEVLGEVEEHGVVMEVLMEAVEHGVVMEVLMEAEAVHMIMHQEEEEVHMGVMEVYSEIIDLLLMELILPHGLM